jgi:WD40 repeat protein
MALVPSTGPPAAGGSGASMAVSTSSSIQSQNLIHPPLQRLRCGSPALRAAFSPSGSLFASAHSDGAVRVFECAGSIPAEPRFVLGGDNFSKGGQKKGENAPRGKGKQPLVKGHRGAVLDLCWLPDGSAWPQINSELGLDMKTGRPPADSAPDAGREAQNAGDGDAEMAAPEGEGEAGTRRSGERKKQGKKNNDPWKLELLPDRLVTASADGTAAVWDVVQETRVRQFRGHNEPVNCVAADVSGVGSRYVFASGGDDGCVRLWDTRLTRPIHTIQQRYPVTSLAMCGTSGVKPTEGEFADAGVRLPVLCVGGIDNVVRVWDMRTLPRSEKESQEARDPMLELVGHTDTVSGLALQPNTKGELLLSYAMDGTLRVWDLRPFVPEGHSRSVSSFAVGVPGQPYNPEMMLLRCAWSADGTRVCAGTPGNLATNQGPTTCVWNADSQRIAYSLPGHSGAVTSVAYHPNAPIVVSSSIDQTLFVTALSRG